MAKLVILYLKSTIWIGRNNKQQEIVLDPSQMFTVIFTGACTIVASAGFWSYFQTRKKKQDAEILLLLGVAQEMFHYIGAIYIQQGYIEREEYAILLKQLYEPYKALGGNGVTDRIMADISGLSFRSSKRYQSYRHGHPIKRDIEYLNKKLDKASTEET